MGPLLQVFLPELCMYLFSRHMARALPVSCSSIWWPDMLYSDSGVIVLSKNGLCHGGALFIIEYEYEMHPVTYSKRKKGSLGRYLKWKKNFVWLWRLATCTITSMSELHTVKVVGVVDVNLTTVLILAIILSEQSALCLFCITHGMLRNQEFGVF